MIASSPLHVCDGGGHSSVSQQQRRLDPDILEAGRAVGARAQWRPTKKGIRGKHDVTSDVLVHNVCVVCMSNIVCIYIIIYIIYIYIYIYIYRAGCLLSSSGCFLSCDGVFSPAHKVFFLLRIGCLVSCA